MKQWLMYAVGLLTLVGVTMLTGCPSKTAPPAAPPGVTAGTRLAPPPPAPKNAPTVMVSLTDTAIKMTPSKAISGPVILNITNDCKADASITLAGPGAKAESKTFKAGEKASITISAAKPGNYTISMKNGTKTIAGSLTVTAAAKPTMPKGVKPNVMMHTGAMPTKQGTPPGGGPGGAQGVPPGGGH